MQPLCGRRRQSCSTQCQLLLLEVAATGLIIDNQCNIVLYLMVPNCQKSQQSAENAGCDVLQASVVKRHACEHLIQPKDGGLSNLCTPPLWRSAKIAHLSFLQVGKLTVSKKTKLSNCLPELTIKMERKLYYQLMCNLLQVVKGSRNS